MKKVFSSASDVAHAFALQNQDEGRNSGRSFYFEGDSLYSYGRHFCVARFISEDTVLFTERTYSNTTAKHTGHARGALRHKNLVQCPYPDGTYHDNFDWWEREVNGILAQKTKARCPENYIIQIGYVRGKVTKYCEARQIEMSDTLRELFAPYTDDVIIQASEKMREKDKAREEKKRAKMELEHAKQLSEFRNGTRNNIYARIDVDYVRRDVDNFVTSQGVRIPIAVGETFYRLLKAGKVSVGDKLEQYSVRSIDADSISIGCHNITMDEIENAINQVSSKTL